MIHSRKASLLPELQTTAERLSKEFPSITSERKIILRELSGFINQALALRQPALLNFICTHNSRRSHIAQLWAQAAAWLNGIPDVYAFSGGTEATAFNTRSVKALSDAGFRIHMKSPGGNPHYLVQFSMEAPETEAFSKLYSHHVNPKNNFAAIMTCAHADGQCPVVAGAAKRISLNYDDPKAFDDTVLEKVKYRERVMEIGRELLYAFSHVIPQRMSPMSTP